MDLLGACLLARRCRRTLAILLGLRRITPSWWERHPDARDLGAEGEGDTGGGGWYRPAHRRQDPAADPQEPNGGESSSRGQDHGWANCTMTSGAMALDYHTQGDLQKWGGHLRHRQGDLDGGTDLYDLRDAWAEYGETLTIRSGRGWEALKEDRADGRFLVVQGQGNVPGSATFDGGHACALGPESKDGDWLWGDPLASGWQWVEPSRVREWMEAWSPTLAYATTAAWPPPPPEPEPEPEPEPPPPVPAPPSAYDQGHAAGLALGRALEADRTFASWHPGGPVEPPPIAGARWDVATWYRAPEDVDVWSEPWPIPLGQVYAAQVPATWGASGWAAAVWSSQEAPGS